MNRKISISGWPGAGTSTICLLLAWKLGLTLVKGTDTFRLLGKELNFENTGIDRINVDKYLEEDFGKIYDKYIDHILTNDKYENILVESDIAAFRLGKKPCFFSIFITTDAAVRMQRLDIDGRDKDIELLKERDEVNRNFYLKLHNVDWFSLDEIYRKHYLVIDNSNISIEEEFIKLYEALHAFGYLSENESDKLKGEATEDDKNYWELGKDWYLQKLKQESRLLTAEKVLKDINSLFNDDIQALPEKLRNIIQKHK